MFFVDITAYQILRLNLQPQDYVSSVKPVGALHLRHFIRSIHFLHLFIHLRGLRNLDDPNLMKDKLMSILNNYHGMLVDFRKQKG